MKNFYLLSTHTMTIQFSGKCSHLAQKKQLRHKTTIEQSSMLYKVRFLRK